MHDELAQIRERNMAMDREENELGVSCLAVPVLIFMDACLMPFLSPYRHRASSR
jgi:hypothetical protein